MICAFFPDPRSLGKIRIFTNSIQRGLQQPVLPWFRVLRHEEHMTPTLPPNLMHELRKTRRVCQVDIRVRLNAMPIPTADKHHVPALSESASRPILFPVP